MDDKMFYKPKNAWVGDVIPYYENGKFKLFYLKDWRNYQGDDVKHGWHLLETTDFVHYEKDLPIGIVGGTGHVIKVDGVYHLYYCVFPKGKQLICHAISKDFLHWETIPEDTFGPDGAIYHNSDFRDPFVFYNDETDEYWMILSARTNGKTSRTGCVGLCTSKDLKKWDYREPLYAPQMYQGSCECPDLFKEGDWWYLIYSNYTNHFGTYYRMSRTLSGPWITPYQDTFDGRAYYAAKSVSDGKDRYLFGWNPTKQENLFQFNPCGYEGKDYNTWDWGGEMWVHKIYPREDGSLAVSPPETVRNLYKQMHTLETQFLTGKWESYKDRFTTSSSGYSSSLIGEMPDKCHISMNVNYKNSKFFGIALRVDQDFDLGYYIVFEPNRNRVILKSHIMMTEEGGKTFPYQVEMERYVNLNENKDYFIQIFIQYTAAVLYVDDVAAMNFRMYDLTRNGHIFQKRMTLNKLGLFQYGGKTTFKDVFIRGI